MLKLYYFDKVSSTNDKAAGFEENSVIVASEQASGRGRFNRKWSSSKGGIYVSLVLKLIETPQYLTFIAAISTQKAIESALNIKTTIKWPNDLLFNGKKICGILTEIKKEKAIVGIGVNTNNEIPLSLRTKSLSLNKIINKKINNNEIIKIILKNFETYLKLLKNNKYNKIIADWKKNSFLGSKIKVKTLGKTYSGIAFGVDEDCFLILKTEKGNVTVREGDVIIIKTKKEDKIKDKVIEEFAHKINKEAFSELDNLNSSSQR